VKEPSDENQTECHEIEPNPSKDRAMLFKSQETKIYTKFVVYKYGGTLLSLALEQW
jgi:hypothetical protein